MKTIGETIRSERQARNMTLRQLASRIGVTEQAISSIELGTTSCGSKSQCLRAICCFLEINIEDFEDSLPKRRIKEINTKPTLGKFLVNQRRKACLSRKKLCEKLGIGVNTLFSIERGEVTRISSDLRESFEKHLSCEIPRNIFSEYCKYVSIERSELGALVFDLRERRGLTLSELSRRSGITALTLSRIEKEKHITPHRRGTIGRIFRALNADFPKHIVSRLRS